MEKDKEITEKKWSIPIGVLIALLVAVAFGLFLNNHKICTSFEGSRKYSGIYETVDSLNGEVLNPLLQQLVTTAFFKYFKVKLWRDCPFWPDDGMCTIPDCSVDVCPDNEFPESFKMPYDHLLCQEGNPQGTVDRTLDNKAFRGWIVIDNPWTNDDETDKGEMTYVDHLLNPERYTRCTGPSPRRIWDAIYSENCPKCSSGKICQEKKVLYNLISGLHSSISIHVAADYLLDEKTNRWGENLELMYDSVLRYPDRVRNLYFTFLFVLRAVAKVSNHLEQADYDSGNHAEDKKAQSLMRQLLNNPKLQVACPLPFDEAKWQGQNGPELKQQIQKQFRNISALMDCVGCERCRLWGKLQVLGLGTALNVLFTVDDQNHHPAQPLQLQRNEVIALVNLLNKLSESIKFAHENKRMMMEGLPLEPPAQDISSWQRLWESVVELRYLTSLLYV